MGVERVGIGLKSHDFITSMNTTMQYLDTSQKNQWLFHNMKGHFLDYYCNRVGSYKNHIRIKMDKNIPPRDNSKKLYVFALTNYNLCLLKLKNGLIIIHIMNTLYCCSIAPQNCGFDLSKYMRQPKGQ